MWSRFSGTSRQAILNAQEIAVRMGSEHVDSAHLFLGLLQLNSSESSVVALVGLAGVSVDEARLYAQSTLEAQPLQVLNPELTASATRVLELAADEAKQLNTVLIGPEHLLVACLRPQKGPHVGEILRSLGLDPDIVRDYLKGLSSTTTPYQPGNPLNHLTEHCKKAIEAAHQVMRASFCGRISTIHLLLGLLDDKEGAAFETLTLADVDIDELQTRLRTQIVSDGEIATTQKKFTSASKRALEWARLEAKKEGQAFIGPQHLLSALLPRPISIQEKLAYGNSVADPLDPIWPSLPVDHIRKVLNNGTQRVELETADRGAAHRPIAHELSLNEARQAGSRQVTMAHLLLGVLNDPDATASDLARIAGVNIQDLVVRARALRLGDALEQSEPVESTGAVELADADQPEHLLQYSKGYLHVVKMAVDIVAQQRNYVMTSGHLLLALIGASPGPLPDTEARLELEAVRGLFSEEQQQRLRAELQESISRADRLAQQLPRSARSLVRLFAGCSAFFTGLISAFMMTRFPVGSPMGRNVVLGFLAILLTSGIVTVATILSNRSQRTKDFWMTLFGGCIGGLIVGFFLFKR